MALPWFRLDTHIGDHDKMLALVSDPLVKPRLATFQAAFSYVCSIGWSVDHGTDGRIPMAALPFIHGTPATARMLVQDRGFGQLWREKDSASWEIVNFAERQQLDVVTAGKQEARRFAALKANCVRHHGKGCWQNGRCSRDSD
jgi:hypothetical protein